MTDFTKKQRLFSAMTKELRAAVQPLIKNDDSWEEIIQTAERFDAAQYQARRQQSNNSQSNHSRKPFKRKNQENTSRPPTPRNSQKKASTFSKLTPEIRSQLLKEGKCLYCREKGHILTNCPKRPKKAFQPTTLPIISSAAISTDLSVSSAALIAQ